MNILTNFLMISMTKGVIMVEIAIFVMLIIISYQLNELIKGIDGFIKWFKKKAGE